MFRVLCGALCAIFSLSACEGIGDGKNEYQADVVVYGGTAGGVAAAVQASREGKSVILVCPDKHLGAMTSSGLGYTDAGKSTTIGGVSKEFYHRAWKEYQKPFAWNFQKREDWKGKGQQNSGIDDENQLMWVFEPHVAETVFEDWLKEEGVKVYKDEWLNRNGGVAKDGTKIVSIRMLSGKTFKAKVFMDCTFEGDLFAAAGCSYHVGREANSVYGEKYNGVQTGVLHHDHFFRKDVSPYKVVGDKSSGALKYISTEDPGKFGEGDNKVQAYCFRMCLTNVKENQLPFTKPANYNAEDYALSLRYMQSEGRVDFMIFSMMPNYKTDCNNKGAFSTDFIGMNYKYPEASYEERAKIIQAHKDYQMGWYYFLVNDKRVPEPIQNRMSEWGLAKDEFTDTGSWPFNLYIREARRLIGEYVMTENDCTSKIDTPKSVGMGSYTLDSHNVQRYIKPDGFVQNEGDIGVHIKYPYKISYDSLTPKKSECTNLLVPVSCSSSHMAFGSIRMEPVFMILGHSAATAAAMAIDAGIAVQDVDYAKLKTKLLKDGQILEMSGEMKAKYDEGALKREEFYKRKAEAEAKKAEAEAKKAASKK